MQRKKRWGGKGNKEEREEEQRKEGEKGKKKGEKEEGIEFIYCRFQVLNLLKVNKHVP